MDLAARESSRWTESVSDAGVRRGRRVETHRRALSLTGFAGELRLDDERPGVGREGATADEYGRRQPPPQPLREPDVAAASKAVRSTASGTCGPPVAATESGLDQRPADALFSLGNSAAGRNVPAIADAAPPQTWPSRERPAGIGGGDSDVDEDGVDEESGFHERDGRESDSSRDNDDASLTWPENAGALPPKIHRYWQQAETAFERSPHSHRHQRQPERQPERLYRQRSASNAGAWLHYGTDAADDEEKQQALSTAAAPSDVERTAFTAWDADRYAGDGDALYEASEDKSRHRAMSLKNVRVGDLVELHRRNPWGRAHSNAWLRTLRALGARLARFVFSSVDSPVTSGSSSSDSDNETQRSRRRKQRRSGKKAATRSRSARGARNASMCRTSSISSLNSLGEEQDGAFLSDAEAHDGADEPDAESIVGGGACCAGGDAVGAHDEEFSAPKERAGAGAGAGAAGGASAGAAASFSLPLPSPSPSPSPPTTTRAAKPLLEELRERRTLPRRALFLARTLALYIWPVVCWLLVFSLFDIIPERVKPSEIHVKTLPLLEWWLHYPHRWFFFGYDDGNGGGLLDFLAAAPYTLHAALPFVFIALLTWRRTPARRILEFVRVWGMLSLVGVLTHMFLPAAPPWYFEKYGFMKATYKMHGDPALLDRVDDSFGVRFYYNMYAQGGKVVFGTFPSLHAGWPYLMAMFEPQQGRFIWLYVLWVWWAALYLQHHYLIDLLGGALYAEALYFLFARHRPHAAESHGQQQQQQGLPSGQQMATFRKGGAGGHAYRPVTAAVADESGISVAATNGKRAGAGTVRRNRNGSLSSGLGGNGGSGSGSGGMVQV